MQKEEWEVTRKEPHEHSRCSQFRRHHLSLSLGDSEPHIFTDPRKEIQSYRREPSSSLFKDQTKNLMRTCQQAHTWNNQQSERSSQSHSTNQRSMSATSSIGAADDAFQQRAEKSQEHQHQQRTEQERACANRWTTRRFTRTTKEHRNGKRASIRE